MKAFKPLSLAKQIGGKHLSNKQYTTIHAKSFPKFVKIVEVGPRDGLQNESKIVPADIKIDMINRLSETGLNTIEATSFVSPKWIPQMSDNKVVFEKINKKPNISYPVLVPNMQGYQNAVATGCKEVAVFASASETFSRVNTNIDIEGSLKRYRDIVRQAVDSGLKARGYVSCAFACPYEGKVSADKVAEVAFELYSMGCYEISIADTIGVSTPLHTQNVLERVIQAVPAQNLAVHFHNTYGQALSNIYASLELGIAAVDSSVAGLGGCPYAKGASGNVPTEDVLFMLNGMGIETGVDLDAVVDVGVMITRFLGKPNQSKVAEALLTKREQPQGQKQERACV